MNTITYASQKASGWICGRPLRKILFSVALAATFLSDSPAQAQTTEAWSSAIDNYTNGPVGGDWNPAITDSVTNWPNNFNGSVSSANGYIVIITNSGTCNYSGSSAGDPNYTNTINDLYLGGTGNGAGGGGVANTFTISGGSLTLSDSAGPSLAIGGVATGGKAGAQSTNFFTMTGGTLIATNAFTNNVVGDCLVGLGTNSMGTMNFNGGSSFLSDLTIGGHGVGIVNIAGGNVTLWAVATRPASFDTMAGGSGTLNISSGLLNASNGLFTLGQGTVNKLSSIINMSGGTFYVNKIQYNGGAGSTNIVNFSGGTIVYYGTTGYGRNGSTSTNRFIMSGGTMTCGPGINTALSSLIPTILTNTPGPGIVTYAPPAGQSMTLPTITGSGTLVAAGPGAVIMGSVSTYTGSTLINGGIFSLSTAGSIASSITIAANATLDLSSLSVPFTLGSGQVLSNSTSSAVIDGSLNTGSGIVSLVYAAGVPALTITTNNSANANANSATLMLSPTTTFNINNTGPTLAAGSYLIISTNSEGAGVDGTPPGTVTVTGNGIQAGNTAVLSIGSNGQLYLVVAAKPPPPTIGTYFPVTYTNHFILYVGASPTFSISASSVAPISYQWFTNGVGVAGATNASLTLSNVPAGVLASYCVASNYAGSTTSFVWTASVIVAPASYPQSVLAANPIGYWRLNEGNDNGSGDDGYIANDYAGGNDGIYTNVTLGNGGYNFTIDPSDTSAGFGNIYPYINNLAGQIQGIDFAVTNGVNAEFSVEAWVQGEPGNESANGTVLAKGVFGLDSAFDLGMDTSTTKHYRFYVRNASGAIFTADSSFVPDSNWHHLAGVCDEANGIVLLYIDGQLAAYTAIPTNSGGYETPSPMTIGAGITNNSPSGYTLQYFGNINDVAVFNHALTANQVASQYANNDVAPLFVQVPTPNVTLPAGSTLTIPVTVAGTGPLNYNWYDQNGASNVVTGVTNGTLLNASLIVSNVPASWNGHHLQLTVNNAYGSTNATVALVVVAAPIITNNLPPQISIGQGQSYTFAPGVIGVMPLSYQWYAGSSAISGQTNATLAAAPASTTTYYVIITNIYGSATSAVSTLTVLPPIGSSSYATNILGLNPVGYWPMHEIETAAPGDTETNYGWLGLLGTGYYADWASPGAPGGILHGVPGALTGNFDTAVAFPGEPSAGTFVECMSIPHTSPLATLNPPFSVECWFYPSNDVGGDIWSQCGYEGLNAGGYGGGAGSIGGIRLFWNTTGAFYLYTYYVSNNLHQVGHMHSTAGAWYHLAVTCDSSTNMTLYVNGTPSFTNNMTGLYTPDYWSPLTLANGKGYQNSQPGNMDEFAIYTNALGATDIAQHFSDGTSGSPGQYVVDVSNDNPLIYLRMNSPAYSPPNPTLLPALVNYGSVGVNGIYSPGTSPGIVAGPSYGGFPINGLSGTNVAGLSGVSSFADAGYAPAYNPTGSNAFSVSAIFRGNPADGRSQTIVGHTTSSWRLWMNTTGHLEWQIAGTTLTSAGIYNDGDWHQVAAVYSPASDPAVSGTNLIYVDGMLDSSVSTVSTNGITGGSTSDVMIGSDPQFTNNPSGLGQQFAGQICEVALFTNVLTQTQVQSLYNVGGIAPFIDGQPITGRGVNSGTGTYIYFGVDAGGTPSLAYQWYFNTAPSFVGATQLVDNGNHYVNSATFEVTVTNLTTADSGYYFVVITNNYGSVTSILASLTVTNGVNTSPTNIVFSTSGSQLTLSWPADHTGWMLQAQTNNLSTGIGTNWSDVIGSTTNDQVIIPVNPTNGSVFYRLVYPPQ